MPYEITLTTNPSEIKEQESGTATEVKFSTFTSCVGVISRKAGSLTAVHLVMVGKDGQNFDDEAARKVLNMVGSSPDEVIVLGNVNSWKASGEIGPAFRKLLDGLGGAAEYTFGDGAYGAKLGEDGKIEITY